jgi:hypothetical protein
VIKVDLIIFKKVGKKFAKKCLPCAWIYFGFFLPHLVGDLKNALYFFSNQGVISICNEVNSKYISILDGFCVALEK